MAVINFLAITPLLLTALSSIKSLMNLMAIINPLKLFAIPIFLGSFLILTFNYFTLLVLPIIPLIILPHLIICQLHRRVIIRPLTFQRIPKHRLI
jgi:hypothetical protein